MMRDKELLEYIKKIKLRPLNSNTTEHVRMEEYMVNGKIVKIYWAIGTGDDNPTPSVMWES